MGLQENMETLLMLVVWVMMISGIFAQYGDDPSEPNYYYPNYNYYWS